MLDFNTLELWNTRFLTAFTLTWFTVLGACLGSFLNVIVWRWPRGRSLSRERSECPTCGAMIRWSDNLPVISWLRLRGRCRDCGGAISSRYPLIELLGAVQILGLLVGEGLSGGANLPVRVPSPTAHIIWDFWGAKSPDLLRTLVVHATFWMLATIVWLVDRDGQRLPRGFWAIVAGFGLTLAVVYPDVHPDLGIGLSRGDGFSGTQRAAGLQWSALGLLAGWGLGIVWARLRGNCVSVVWSPLCALGGLVGVVLGWQAMLSTALAAAVMNALETACFRWKSFGPVGWWWLTLHVQVLVWRSIDATRWWPGRTLPLWGLLGWIAVFIGLAWWSGLGRQRPLVDEPRDSSATASL